MGLFKVFGKLTDFYGNSMVDGVVCIKDAKMNDVYLTHTDKYGNYSFDVEAGDYVAISGVKDYIDSKLEYWCWNLPVYQDMKIDMQIDRMEVYGMNAFLIQRAIQNSSLMIYFRPMSLTYYHKNKDSIEDMNCKLIEVSPEISKNEVRVLINKKDVNIIEMSKITERAMDKDLEGKYLYGYLVQVPIDRIIRSLEYQRVDIELSSFITKEKGQGTMFWRTPPGYQVK